MLNNLSKKAVIAIIFVIFLVSRWYVFENGPKYYSDVKADYERYANMWRYGLTPYREHLYEYPPATIPLLSLPLTLDQASIGKYYSNYRAQVLIIDILFFCYLIWIVQRITWLKNRWIESLLFYTILTALSKEFLYEGLDLIFTACATIGLTLATVIKPKSFLLEVVIWFFFWLSTAIKFLTLPLVAPLFLLLSSGSLAKRILVCAIGFILVWGLPLAMYRSSLQVSFIHNNNRPIKYAAFPAHIIRWVDSFTHTEEQRMVAPDFEYTGPVSNQVTAVTKVVFPAGLLALLLYFTYLIHQKLTPLPLTLTQLKKYLSSVQKLKPDRVAAFGLLIYSMYIFYLFIFAKIFSQPFHIWYIPPFILFPFANKKTCYLVLALCVWMITLDLTTWLHIKENFLVFNTIEIALIRDSFRFIPMFVIAWMLYKETKINPLFTDQK
jgi:hypothetical protein